MKVLICCESSGRVRDAFKAMGHNAWSNDLQPTERPGNHLQCDLRLAIQDSWDFIGFHTDCTFMANSGVRWLFEQQGRFDKLYQACELFNLCLRDPRKGYLENPIPHKYAVEKLDRNYDQIIQPWQFGHTTSKATCLWLKGVTELKATEIIPKEKRTQDIWRMAPGPERKKDRSRTFENIALAFAQQWG